MNRLEEKYTRIAAYTGGTLAAGTFGIFSCIKGSIDGGPTKKAMYAVAILFTMAVVFCAGAVTFAMLSFLCHACLPREVSTRAQKRIGSSEPQENRNNKHLRKSSQNRLPTIFSEENLNQYNTLADKQLESPDEENQNGNRKRFESTESVESVESDTNIESQLLKVVNF